MASPDGNKRCEYVIIQIQNITPVNCLQKCKNRLKLKDQVEVLPKQVDHEFKDKRGG